MRWIFIEQGRAPRVPWVCVGIALLCTGALVYTEYFASGSGKDRARALEELLDYWVEHPYLEPPREASPFLPAGVREVTRQVGEVARIHSQVPPAHVGKQEQKHFDEMWRQLSSRVGGSVFRQWSLVAARGHLQKGLVGHIFLHGGWLHLIGNLFFLYLVGPILEARWGRLRFAGFFLLGGIVAGACQVALDASPDLPTFGASGAVAACMGAFVLGSMGRQIQLFRAGRPLSAPAWLPVAIWLGFEILGFALSDGSIAVVAHLGGFVLGVTLMLCGALLERPARRHP